MISKRWLHLMCSQRHTRILYSEGNTLTSCNNECRTFQLELEAGMPNARLILLLVLVVLMFLSIRIFMVIPVSSRQVIHLPLFFCHGQRAFKIFFKFLTNCYYCFLSAQSPLYHLVFRESCTI